MSRRQRSISHRSGTSLVELALVMTLLCYIVLGSVEYGYMFLRQQQVTNIARQAARLAALPDTTTAQVDTLITTMMSSYGLTTANSNYAKTYSPTNLAPGTGATLSVTITVDYASKLSIVKSTLCPVPAKLKATVTMEKEGT